MKIEIWTDFVCPFCYIGKRKLEHALEKFAHADQVEIEYKSYQLDPHAKFIPGKRMDEVLAENKGIPVEQMRAMNQQVTQMAKAVGLDYHLESAKHTNTFDAHRLFQYVQKIGKGDAFMERLKKAYFTESLLLSDFDVLADLAAEIGVDRNQAKAILESNEQADEVHADIQEARQIGVQGVPFFVFNRKYAISGAQPDEVFDQTLQTVWEDQ